MWYHSFLEAASYSVEGGEVEPPYEFVVDAVEVLEERDRLKQDEVNQIEIDWYEKRKAS